METIFGAPGIIYPSGLQHAKWALDMSDQDWVFAKEWLQNKGIDKRSCQEVRAHQETIMTQSVPALQKMIKLMAIEARKDTIAQHHHTISNLLIMVEDLKSQVDLLEKDLTDLK
jgi:hypothetical protein